MVHCTCLPESGYPGTTFPCPNGLRCVSATDIADDLGARLAQPSDSVISAKYAQRVYNVSIDEAHHGCEEHKCLSDFQLHR